MPNMKEKVLGILKDNGFTEWRSNKMDMEAFLKLLKAFNEHDIHFA
jgi:hypothetical protein